MSFSPTWTYLVNSSLTSHVSFSSRLHDIGGNFLLAGAWNAFVDTVWNWLKTPIKPVTWCFSRWYTEHSLALVPAPSASIQNASQRGGSGHIEDRVSGSDKSCLEIDRVSVINNSCLGSDRWTSWIWHGRQSFHTRIRFFTVEFLTLR